ncbi:hypothetical protein [Psychroflexus salis]|uniref:VWFA domain-containing protein n=1 Tax=Psychroflexus salis TaxID=1526574 RepID=A0A916ZV33_9FLAO|nr:hypothetical protein [Psychroflexus salis]GGE15574.1 hypothetical protein GCM10010831_16120 [Psychroflexus salis]
MNELIERVEWKRKIYQIRFLVDASNAVNEEKLLIVKTKITEILDMVRDSFKENYAGETSIYVNVLKISDKSEWMYESLVPVSDFIYKDFSPESSDCNLENALQELISNLSHELFSQDMRHAGPPSIVFLLNGDSIELSNVSHVKKQLKGNKLYRLAFKFAISLGDSLDNQHQLFEILTISPEAIMSLSDINVFKNIYCQIDELVGAAVSVSNSEREWWNNLELNWKIILLSNYCFNRIGWNLNDCNIECFAFQGNIEKDLIGFAVWAGGGDDFDFKENIENISDSILYSIIHETKILWCARAKVKSIDPLKILIKLKEMEGLIFQVNEMEIEMKSVPKKNNLPKFGNDETLSKNSNIPDFNDDGWV